MEKKSILDIIRKEREYGTEPITVNITKSSQERIYWASKEKNIEYEEALELLIHEGSNNI